VKQIRIINLMYWVLAAAFLDAYFDLVHCSTKHTRFSYFTL